MPTIQLISPVDGSVYAERETWSLESASEAIDRARMAQAAWAARPLPERVRTILDGINALEAMNNEIVPELAWQMGRPIRFGGEFGGVRERATYMASIASTALADSIIEESERFNRVIAREPQGIVFVIAPWNYPFLTAINSIVPALIAGNAVILKHASQTMLAGERLVSAFTQAGVPAEVFQNVVLDHATTEALISKGSFDFINFTGSVKGGRAIERAAAGTFTGLGLELGGKDPGYVRSDADLEAAVDGLLDGAMFNSGQCCCGIERIYVHEQLYDAFVEKAISWVRRQRLGNPLDTETTIGPMAHVRFAEIVRTQIAEAVAAGARPMIDVTEFPADDGGAYLAPQILTHVTHDMAVMGEENFGPVVGIMPVQSDAEAIALMNDSNYGLTASIWTQDADAAYGIGNQIETGTIFMNRCDYLDPALCWTGCKNTGRGTTLSTLGYHALTRVKSYHLKKA
jgi:acyl-CoA reductase-like NAD-dependent aldehyde dehydrogenase